MNERRYELYSLKVAFLNIPDVELEFNYERFIASVKISDWPKQTFRVFDSIEKTTINPNVSDIFINGKDELVCFESGEIHQCHDHYEREDFMGFFDSMKMPVFENDLLCYAFAKDGKLTIKPACVCSEKRIWLKGENIQIDSITHLPWFQNGSAVGGIVVGHCDKFSGFGEHQERMMTSAFLSSVKLLKIIIQQTIDSFSADEIKYSTRTNKDKQG